MGPKTLWIVIAGIAATGASAAPAQPPAAPTQAAAHIAEAPRYASGDAWTYGEFNQFSRQAVGDVVRTVQQAGPLLRIETRDAGGNFIGEADFLPSGAQTGGFLSNRAAGSLVPPLIMHPFPMHETGDWEQAVTRTDPYWHEAHSMRIAGRIEGWEDIEVPAGGFRALKIVRFMRLGDGDGFRGETARTEWEWWVPELKAPARLIIWEEHKEPDGRFGETVYDTHRRYDLRSYHLAE